MKENPYGLSITNFIEELKNIGFEFPFIPNIIQFFILIFLIILNSLLYITIGIISQIRISFWYLIKDSSDKMNNDEITSSLKISYSIAIGIYILFIIPCFVIELPFLLIAIIVEVTGIFGGIISFILISLLCFSLYSDNFYPIKNLYFTYDLISNIYHKNNIDNSNVYLEPSKNTFINKEIDKEEEQINNNKYEKLNPVYSDFNYKKKGFINGIWEGSISIFKILTLKFPPYNYITTGWFFYNIGFILGIIIEFFLFVFFANIFFDNVRAEELSGFSFFINSFWIIISSVLFLVNN